MERIKFYFDEHISSAVSNGLRRRGVDVLTVQAARRNGLPDSEQLAFATEEGRVMVTMDSDFIALAQVGKAHAGIAYIHSTTSIGQQIKSLMLICDVLEPNDMLNHIEFL